MTAPSEGNRRDDNPGIIRGAAASPLEKRAIEVSMLDAAIRLKMDGLDSEHKRRSKDNRSRTANLQVNILAAFDSGLLDTLGGQLPPDPQPIANVAITVAEKESKESKVSLEIKSKVPGMLPNFWHVTIKDDGTERWTFIKDGKRRVIEPGSALNMRRVIVEQADHPEKTIDTYHRVIDKWADEADWSADKRQLNHNSLQLADKYLGKVRRKSKELHIVHLWETARQMWAWGIHDPDELAAAIMHDMPEDSPEFAPIDGETVSRWQRKVLIRIRRELHVPNSHRAAYLAMMMSRPPKGVTVEDPESPGGRRLLTDEERDELYDEQIESSQALRRIKIPDRLHNIRTLWAMAAEKRAKTIRETQTIYPKLIVRIGQENQVLARRMQRDLGVALSEYIPSNTEEVQESLG